MLQCREPKKPAKGSNFKEDDSALPLQELFLFGRYHRRRIKKEEKAKVVTVG